MRSPESDANDYVHRSVEHGFDTFLVDYDGDEDTVLMSTGVRIRTADMTEYQKQCGGDIEIDDDGHLLKEALAFSSVAVLSFAVIALAHRRLKRNF